MALGDRRPRGAGDRGVHQESRSRPVGDVHRAGGLPTPGVRIPAFDPAEFSCGVKSNPWIGIFPKTSNKGLLKKIWFGSLHGLSWCFRVCCSTSRFLHLTWAGWLGLLSCLWLYSFQGRMLEKPERPVSLSGVFFWAHLAMGTHD